MALQSIVTRYLGPTNYRGSRVKATASAGSAVVSWDCSLSADANHKAAAEALARKFGWRGRWIEGGMHRPKRLKMAKPAALAMAEASLIPLD